MVISTNKLAAAQVRRRVRQIDCVTVKGSVRPMGLYTYDVTLEAVPLPSLSQWGAATPTTQASGFANQLSPTPRWQNRELPPHSEIFYVLYD